MQQKNPSSLIFPEIQPLPQVLGDPRLRSDVLLQIQSDPGTHAIFQSFIPQEQDAFLGFCMGERGLKVTYDPFFKHIFNPELHPERLNRLLSCILDQEVAVREVLPLERVGYDFPIERSFCYGADLLVRQYDLVREGQGKDFSYRCIKPVYVIVLMEESPPIFRETHGVVCTGGNSTGQYIHRSRFSFDTGLKMNSLQNFIYISLDIFRGMEHNDLTEFEARLYFLGSDDPADILRIIRRYPFFQELYRDIVNFRFQPKELIAMFSDALRILDQNTVEYMIDELKAELSKKDSELSETKSELSKKDSLIASLLSEIEQLKK